MKLEILASWALPPREGASTARLAPNGEWLARSEGARVVLEQALTGRELARLDGGAAPVLCLAVAPDSSWLVAGSDVQDEWFTLRVYARQEQHWALASEFEAHQRTTAVAIADGNVFASAGDGVVTVWSLEQGDLWSSEAGSEIGALAFSADGERLAVARAEQVEVWSREGNPLWKAAATACSALAFLDERVVASGPHGLYRLAQGEVEEHVSERFLGEEPRARFDGSVWFGPGVSTAGPLRLACGPGMELWRHHERLWRRAAVEEMLVGSGRVLLSGGDRLSVRDLEGQELARHDSQGGLGKLSLSVRGELAGWVTNSELVVVELASGAVVGRCTRRNLAARVGSGLVFGKLLVYPEWKLETDASFEGWSDLVAPKLVLTPDGQSACLAVPEGGLRRARLQDGLSEQTYYGSSMPDRQVVRAPWLVAWTHEAITRWDLASGAVADVTVCPSMGLGGVAVSPDGTRALALSETRARLYALDTQTELGTLELNGPTVPAALDRERWLVATEEALLVLRLPSS